jgi:hypothetical protein
VEIMRVAERFLISKLMFSNQMFEQLLNRFQDKDVISKVADQEDSFNRVVLPGNDATEHDNICFLASLLYPTLDCKCLLVDSNNYIANLTDITSSHSLLDHHLLLVCS